MIQIFSSIKIEKVNKRWKIINKSKIWPRLITNKKIVEKSTLMTLFNKNKERKYLWTKEDNKISSIYKIQSNSYRTRSIIIKINNLCILNMSITLLLRHMNNLMTTSAFNTKRYNNLLQSYSLLFILLMIFTKLKINKISTLFRIKKMKSIKTTNKVINLFELWRI